MTEKTYQVKVLPNSKENKIIEISDNLLKIRLKAPAKEGKANKALLDFLSNYFKIAKSRIEIKKGLKSKNKEVRVLFGKT